MKTLHDLQPDDEQQPDAPPSDESDAPPDAPLSWLDRLGMLVGVYDEEYGRPNYKALGNRLCGYYIGVMAPLNFVMRQLHIGPVKGVAGDIIFAFLVTTYVLVLGAWVAFYWMEVVWQAREEAEWRRTNWRVTRRPGGGWWMR